jgi:NarL family two-component system response regulator LiaR
VLNVERPISIIIVDDHPIVRSSLRAYLSSLPEFEVVGEAESGEAAILLIRQYLPDVVLMDLILPGRSSIDTTRLVKQVSPNTNVIVLTSSHKSELIYKALRAGASSYISKDQKMEYLTRTIHKVMKGQITVPPRVAYLILENMPSLVNDDGDMLCELTDREIEVLNLIADGYSSNKIADELSINQKIVDGHIRNILSKLQFIGETNFDNVLG